jgi:hypothetical protein
MGRGGIQIRESRLANGKFQGIPHLALLLTLGQGVVVMLPGLPLGVLL